MEDSKQLVPVELIEKKIYLIRGHKVMLDLDLAALYRVETKALKQAVKRNIKRFPEDFMYVLSQEEFKFLRSQIVGLLPKSHFKFWYWTSQGRVVDCGTNFAQNLSTCFA